MQALFATYALKWKEYFLTSVLIWYLGCFVPVMCLFGVSESLSRFSISKNPASRNINTGKANWKPFLVAEAIPQAELKRVISNTNFSRSVALGARIVPIKSQPTVEPVAGPSMALALTWLSGLSTREGIPRAPDPHGEHTARGAEENNIEGARPGAEVPGLTQANLKRLEGKDTLAAALAPVVSSRSPFETAPIPAIEEIDKFRGHWAL